MKGPVSGHGLFVVGGSMWVRHSKMLGAAALLLVALSARTTIAAFLQDGPQSTFVNLARVSNDYQIGPGDLLDIQVVGHPTLNQALRVSNSGEVSFPLVGFLRVADLTVFEIEDKVAQALGEKKLIENADVLVLVREYQAKPIYVSGAVVTPGEFVMSQELTVVDAILLAGGLQFNAADEALLHRRTGAAGNAAGTAQAGAAGVETIRVDLRPVKEGKFLENAVTLKRGDTLFVPDMVMNPFYVVGEVLEPRNFFYSPGQSLTASQAISWSGGPTVTAKLSSGMLVRYDEQGNRIEKKVDYKAILEGRQPDFLIHPEDIIFIPGSKVKALGHGLLLLTDNMVMQASFRIGRTYQLPDAPDRGDR